MRRTAGFGLVLLLALAAGCGSGSGSGGSTAAADVDVTSPLDACEQLAAPPPEATASSPADGLPALTLPCFTGGTPFTLSNLHGPAVVNLWASWCPPCREELPVLQRFADDAAGRVHVLGVITEEPRPAAAASLARDLGLTFPSVADRDGELGRAAGFGGLPVTLYVDATGELAYYHQGPLDEATLAEQATEHLGIGV